MRTEATASSPLRTLVRWNARSGLRSLCIVSDGVAYSGCLQYRTDRSEIYGSVEYCAMGMSPAVSRPDRALCPNFYAK
jgi:hypothetical protein